MRGLEPVDPVDSGSEQDPVTQLRCAQSKPGCEVGFPGAGRAEQDDVGCLGQERPGRQVGDRVVFEAWLVVEAEVLQRFTGREPRGPGTGFGSGGFAGGDFPGKDRGEVFLMGPAGLSCKLGETGGRFPDPGCFHGPGVVLDLADGFLGPGQPRRGLGR